ncbi:tRNA (mnm(5)s(2)U34)-methyltransferase [Clostridium sp. 'White wine YQ']|uniref:tRNA (mnm(5)s(2)U34)-methyltransferase n=1 Tax=Clostridium sp. 'White wine YQ' TaxID=3027474 RepID=UPI00236727A6|nr:class I SAM-dependent methyltransferase [Clostridium sp. 'White wine YQ']MDD7793853.1 class I SAM-dependent methyltransferase [Clostridium sp. 'White wine YQ']
MFKLVKDISSLSHDIIDKYIENKNLAIDCTLGNGYDSDFLSESFNKVIAFDIQEMAITNYKNKNKDNVYLIQDSHDKLNEYAKESADCIIYNLGFLPGGNKEITTMKDSTMNSIIQALDLINAGGIILIAIYSGHNEGAKEKTCILEFAENLPKNKYGVMKFEYVNRNNNPPMLLCIEKK